ncbi:MAG: MBL fold metallo-hydrolase [Bacillota bacterium]
MKTEVAVLASGSSGNSVYISSGKYSVLIDAGLSGKELERRMKKLNLNPEDLSAVLITHEHNDHIKGAGILSRRYNLPLYANQGTWSEGEEKLGKIKSKNCNIFSDDFMIGDLAFLPYNISHDAAEPVGYICRAGGKKIAVATDTGILTDDAVKKLSGSDFLILESNHDLEMLMTGKYPYYLKNRIKSSVGHLSNDAAADILPDLIDSNFPTVVLAHLSQENNNPRVAYITVNNNLQRAGLKVGKHLNLECAVQDKPTELFDLDKRYDN